MTWTPINDYPGDQRYDGIPRTRDASFWGEIGTTDDGWSWTIMCHTDHETFEIDGGRCGFEAWAKAAVESWLPKGLVEVEAHQMRAGDVEGDLVVGRAFGDGGHVLVQYANGGFRLKYRHERVLVERT